MSNTDQTQVMGATGIPSDRAMVVPAEGIGATMQMPAGGLDPLRTQMGGTATCPVCKSTTPLPEIYCGDCGFLLASTPAEVLEIPEEEPPAAELVDMTDGRRYRLKPGLNTLGRQGTDLLSTEGTVSRMHARITVADGAVTVEDLGSSNGTKVGDRRLAPNQPTTAPHGMPLRFGNWRVTLEIPGGGPPVAAPADRTIVTSEPTLVGALPVEAPTPEPVAPSGPVMAILQKIEGSTDDIPVTHGSLTFGRKAENTIALPQDPYISGRHAEIVTDNTGSYLVDLGSTNGTIINGERLVPQERQLLLEGDEVQIGQSKYVFRLMELADDEFADEIPVDAEDATESKSSSEDGGESDTPT